LAQYISHIDLAIKFLPQHKGIWQKIYCQIFFSFFAFIFIYRLPLSASQQAIIMAKKVTLDTTSSKNEPKKSKKTDKKTKKKGPVKEQKASYHRRSTDLTLDMWQLKLRKQFGEDNAFDIINIGQQPFFSVFEVHNPANKNRYQVGIRGPVPKNSLPPYNSPTFRGNFCSCQDFKTNRLGLCKHISHVMHSISKKRGFKTIMKTVFRPEYSTIYVDYRDGKRIRLQLGTAQETELQTWSQAWFDTDGFLSEAGAAQFEKVIEEARALQPEFVCESDAIDIILETREHLRRQQHLAQVLPEKTDSAYLDNFLKVKLFPYQKTGVWFAAHTGRCLIADEMGLGKTIQAIGAAELLRREYGIQKAVIVCPTSLKYQWRNEIKKFSDATVNVVEGLQTKRRQQYDTNEAFFQVISYNTVANDAEYINAMQPDLLIVDEAQRIKNFRTKVSAQLKKIHTPLCIVLTGTPIENKLEELYSIVQLVDQHHFPPLYRFLDRYQIVSDTGQVAGYKNLKEIGEVMSGVMLRRTKKEVLKQMPKRMDKVLYVPMTPQQMQQHRELSDFVAQLVAKWRKFHFLSEKDRRMLILCLAQMRMVCDSTFILDQTTRFDTKIDELLCIFEEALADPEQKIVIFSQWERMTRLVAQELEARDIKFSNLHGGIPSTDRQTLIDDFTNDPNCRIFLSTDAGGVGLNLQVASMLINLDLPWNPAILEQRVGRIYRMGQEKNIRVINMVSSGTIEERMLDVLTFKSSMAQGVLDPDGDDTIYMSEAKFKKFMENVEGLTEASAFQSPASTEDTALEQAESEDFEAPPTESAKPGREQTSPDVFDAEEAMTAPTATQSASKKPAADPTAPPAPPRAEPSPSDPVTTPQSDTPSAPRPAPAASTAPVSVAPPATPQALIQSGVSFLSGLAQTLSSPEKTQELVQSLVAKDEQTGQSYLKIPVENAAVVENAIKLLGGLFAGLGK
jgi:superfamily II DNA or RNA helicase